jgi:hypothetical protein
VRSVWTANENTNKAGETMARSGPDERPQPIA